MKSRYTDIVLNISDYGNILRKEVRVNYFFPNKYEKIILPKYLDKSNILTLAQYLENLYEIRKDEDFTLDYSEEEYKEYHDNNYVEFNNQSVSKSIFRYIELLFQKEFIVMDAVEHMNFEGVSVSRIELKYENLKLKK